MLASNATCRQRLTNFQQHERIDGWLQPAVVYAVDAVQRTHDELNITGALLEIGVHHGKFYLALDQCRRDTEAGYAMDLYEAGQKLNLDKSGRGSLAAFKGHLKRWSRDPSATQIVSGDSTRLAHTEFARSLPPIRLFSLDGGHTAAHAASDLRFAERVVANGLPCTQSVAVARDSSTDARAQLDAALGSDAVFAGCGDGRCEERGAQPFRRRAGGRGRVEKHGRGRRRSQPRCHASGSGGQQHVCACIGVASQSRSARTAC